MTNEYSLHSLCDLVINKCCNEIMNLNCIPTLPPQHNHEYYNLV